MAPMAASGCSTPISLFAAMIEMRMRAVGDCCTKLVEIDEPLRIDAEPRDAAAFLLEAFERVEDGLVLGCGRDDVIAAIAPCAHDPLDGEVVRLAGAAREDDLGRIRADQSGDLRPRNIDGFLRLPAIRMLPARRVAEFLVEVRKHCLEHPRIDGGRGVEVEVDGA